MVASVSTLYPSTNAAAFRSGLVNARPMLLRRALKLTRNAVLAEDLVQDTVVRALAFEGHYEHGTNLAAWLNQVLFSVFVTRCRRRARERRALDGLTTDPCAWTQVDSVLPTPGLSRRVEGALAALPPQFAAVIRLVDLGEASYRDAAVELGVPVGTVMSRLFRGRRLLAASLEPRSLEAA
jgi:RNA polymerase sigma-70 factor (ECF subfamily)